VVSIVLNSHLPRAWNIANPADVHAAQKIDALANRVFIEPLTKGEYPQITIDSTKDITDWSFVQPGDLDAIKGTVDLIGVNYYSSHSVRHREGPRIGHRRGRPQGHAIQLLARRG